MAGQRIQAVAARFGHKDGGKGDGVEAVVANAQPFGVEEAEVKVYVVADDDVVGE